MVPDLRPRGIGEILDAGVSLYRTRFGQLVRYAAIVVVPVQLLVTLVLLSAQPSSFSGITLNGSATPQFTTSRAQLGATFVLLIAGLLTPVFVSGVTTRVLADEYIGFSEPAGQAARTTSRRFLVVVAAGIAVGLCEIIGLLFCGVGWFVAAAFFSVAIPVVILERRRALAAMGRSLELTRAHFWHVLGVVLTASALSTLLNLALATGLDIWSTHGGSATSVVVAQGFANTIAALITGPFVAATIVALYFDLRIRDEAFDVQMAIAQ